MTPMGSIHGHLYKLNNQHISAILKICSEIELRKCFAIKTTTFHYIVTINDVNDEQFYNDVSSSIKYAPELL